MRPFLLAAMISSAFAADFPEPAQLPASPTLPPDALTMRDGTHITTAQDWTAKRKPELRALIQHYEYGLIPPAPHKIEFRLIADEHPVFGGKAMLREIAIRYDDRGEFALLVVVPAKHDQPVPCFVGLNFNGNHALVDDPLVRIPDSPPRSKRNAASGKETD